MFLCLVKLYYFSLQVQWRWNPIQLNGHRVRQKNDIWEKNCRAPDSTYWGECQQWDKTQPKMNVFFYLLSVRPHMWSAAVVCSLWSEVKYSLYWTPSINLLVSFVTPYLSTTRDVSHEHSAKMQDSQWRSKKPGTQDSGVYSFHQISGNE